MSKCTKGKSSNIASSLRAASACFWLTEIENAREHEYFVDEQRAGPYRFWYHAHTFSQAQKGVKMIDHVTYAAPFDPLGDLVNAIWIRGRLNGIFEYRHRKIAEIFGDAK